MGLLGVLLLGSFVAPAIAQTGRESAFTVKIVAYDDMSFEPLVTAKVGQLLDVGVNTTGGDPEIDLDFFESAQVCINGSPDICHPAKWVVKQDDQDRTEWWEVRVQPTMIVGKRLSLYVTFKGEVVAQRSFPVTASSATPKVEWANGPGLDSISICYSQAGLPPGFTAQLRVRHSWVGHTTPEMHTFKFSFKPATTFRAAKYRGTTHYVSIFDQYCLEVVPLLTGFGSRTGYFAFTYIYNNRPVSSARYKYVISRTRTHYAKEASDEFFNYCLKQHPDTIFSSGGVLMCRIPGSTLIVYRKY